MDAFPAPAFLSREVKRGDYWFLNLSPSIGTDLEVVCGGREVCGGDYRIDRPGFRYSSLEFVASGQGRVNLNGKWEPLLPGTVFTYGPGIAHRIEGEATSPMVKYFVDFLGTDSTALTAKAFPDGGPWVVSSAAWIQRLFEDLKAAADTLSDSRGPVCVLVVRQLFALLADRSQSAPHESSHLNQRFLKLKAQLGELALRGLSLAEAARECGVSPSYLGRLFRLFDQESPHRYLVRCRMAFAASLLLDPQLLVKEVAALAGYDDQYHFSRTFKAFYGQPPEGFRKLRS